MLSVLFSGRLVVLDDAPSDGAPSFGYLVHDAAVRGEAAAIKYGVMTAASHPPQAALQEISVMEITETAASLPESAGLRETPGEKYETAANHPPAAASQETPLSDAEIQAFKEAVRKVAAQTESLTADFSQSRHSRYLAKAAESRGKLSFQKPGHVRWKYTSPSSYSVLFRENRMYINDAGKKKDVNAGKRLEKLNKLIAGSVTGDMFDAPEFTFSFARSGGNTVVRLFTKEASLKKYIREIELTFENNTVSEVKMTEPSQDYTRIILKNKVLNSRIDPAIFVP